MCLIPVDIGGGMSVNIEAPLVAQLSSANMVCFSVTAGMSGGASAVYTAFGGNSGSDEWNVTAYDMPRFGVPSYVNETGGQVLGVTRNGNTRELAWVDPTAPLIVTLTESGGTITGDKTYQEVNEARFAGRPVDLVMTGYVCSSVLDVSDGEVDGESTISVTFIANGQLATATGAPSDYIGITLG